MNGDGTRRQGIHGKMVSRRYEKCWPVCLSQEDAQAWNKWKRKIKGQLPNAGSSGKWLPKTVYLYVVLYCFSL